MNRRLFVAGGIASAAGLVARPTRAQNATPASGAALYTAEVVMRTYTLASPGLDTMLRGQPAWMTFTAWRFSSRGDAEGSVLPIRERILLSWRDGHTTRYRLGSPQPVSVRRMGDEARAWAMAIEDTSGAGDDAVLALVLARKQAIVCTATAAMASGNPYPLLADQVAAMLGRAPGAASLHTDDDGMHHGELWDVLPTLADMPEGYQFDSDTL